MKVGIQSKRSMAVFMSILMALTLWVPTAYGETQAVQTLVNGISEESDAARYLHHFYDVSFTEESVSQQAFHEALAKIGQPMETDSQEAPFTVEAAIVSLVKAAGMKELALTYPEEKIQASLSTHQQQGISPEAAAYVACALDTGLVSSSLEMTAPLDAQTAHDFIMKAVDVLGKGRQYLGWTDQPEIYSKVMTAWNSFTLFEEATLDSIGVGLIKEEATTGYLLTYSGNDAGFMPEYTLQYDHSNITHALQLIGLLASEGLQARVQLEPKTSVYEYMLEWGPIGDPTPHYAVLEVSEDLYLAHSVGYILSLEFTNLGDKQAFDGLIEAYAKKYEGNEDALGLIAGSYWQPLYSSRSFMPDPAYVEIRDIGLSYNGYQLNSFTLKEHVALMKETIQAMSDLRINKEKLWTNAAFHRYLTGSDFQ